MGFKIEDLTALTDISLNIDKLPKDDKTMLEVYTNFKTYMDKYVPRLSETLATTAFATPNYVQYNGPYAHYVWEGVVYGPNIPIKDAQGNITGYRSPPGKGSKYPTGNPMKYTNPLATHHWNEAVITNEGSQFANSLAIIINRYLKEKEDNG